MMEFYYNDNGGHNVCDENTFSACSVKRISEWYLLKLTCLHQEHRVTGNNEANSKRARTWSTQDVRYTQDMLHIEGHVTDRGKKLN